MNLVHIIDNLVINVSTGDLETTQNLFPDQLILESDIAGIGWSWNGSELLPPVLDPPPVSPTPTPKITRLAFRNRFTVPEKVALYDAAKVNTQLQVFLDDLAMATYIDLTRPDTIGGVQFLESAGLLASGRANEILTTPPTNEELYR